jgi:hypothetical protein
MSRRPRVDGALHGSRLGVTREYYARISTKVSVRRQRERNGWRIGHPDHRLANCHAEPVKYRVRWVPEVGRKATRDDLGLRCRRSSAS